LFQSLLIAGRHIRYYTIDMTELNNHEDPDRPASERPSDSTLFGKAPPGLATAAKVFRVATAVTVFAIPLVVGTAALVGFGAREVYKRLRRK
jgi:hypothetical protein